MPCVQDCELILMRSGSDKADKRYGILTQHMASLQHASYFAISNRFLPSSFELRSSKFNGWKCELRHDSIATQCLLVCISFALSELQPAMSSYLSIFPTKSLPLNGWGSQDASWLMIGNKPYLHIYRLCMQTPAEVLATDRCRVADGGGRWPPYQLV